MPFVYSDSPTSGPLRQGEVLGPVWDHHASYPPIPLARGRSVAVTSTLHDLRIVLSPDCDLLWDFEARFDPLGEVDPKVEHPNLVSQILVCNLHSYGQMRPRFKDNRDGWTRVDGNQDQRYHHFEPGNVGASDLCLNDLFLDFKKVTGAPTTRLYEGIALGNVRRVAVVPDVYLHDLIHRFSGFLSRVALPEEFAA
jgi:hypothetical protein